MDTINKMNRFASASQPAMPGDTHHRRIVSTPNAEQCLDSVQLGRLEQAFRRWAEDSPRDDLRKARRRILVAFLLIRYTGAKLSEVLGLNPLKDIDLEGNTVAFHSTDPDGGNTPRSVEISHSLSTEIQAILSGPFFRDAPRGLFDIDPGFVRRKFYERALACGFSKRLGGPEMIRKARAVELLQGGLPLPAVQTMLGHSTPNLTSSYLSFSPDDIRQVIRLFIEKETSRKTSARNAFFGKIETIQKGDIQTRVVLTTISGYSVSTVITNDSLERLALKKGQMITAEVKAPWVVLHGGKAEPDRSAENRFRGVVDRINTGGVNTEYVVRIADGTALCAVVSTESARRFRVEPGERVWAVFNGFAVVLHVD